MMTDDELYLFDLNGYIVVEGVLSIDEVAWCNEAIDHQIATGVAKLVERLPEEALDGGGQRWWVHPVLWNCEATCWRGSGHGASRFVS